MKKNKNDGEDFFYKIPFIDNQYLKKKDFNSLLKILFFCLGFLIVFIYNLISIVNVSRGDFYSFMLKDALTESVLFGSIFGIILAIIAKK